MPKATPSQDLTAEEYLEDENFSDIKHEYIDGQVYAMVGATSAHNIVSGNIFSEIRSHLKGNPCQPFMSDMKVKVDSKFFYADVLVDCAGEMNNKSLFSEKPSLIIEVLSDSTRKFDETTKFHAYKNIESLQEYVLMEQDFMKIQVHRLSDNWHSRTYYSGEEVSFESIGLVLPIEDAYEGVKLEDLDDAGASE